MTIEIESEAIVRIRTICLGLPEAEERPFGGHTAPSFRVRDKLFVSIYEDGSAMILKGAPGVQQALVGSAPARYFIPAYVGHRGWVGIKLDGDPDWDELTELIRDSYRRTAPKRLLALMSAGDPS